MPRHDIQSLGSGETIRDDMDSDIGVGRKGLSKIKSRGVADGKLTKVTLLLCRA